MDRKMMIEEARNVLEFLQKNPDRVEQAYSGRAGCMCGCRGTYTEDTKKVLARVKASLRRLTNQDELVEAEVKDVNDFNGGYVYLESENGGVNCVYLKEAK